MDDLLSRLLAVALGILIMWVIGKKMKQYAYKLSQGEKE